MSGDRLERPRGATVTDDLRQLAVAGVHRRVPAEDVGEVLDILGLAEPEPHADRRLDGSIAAGAEKRYCGCGKEIRAAGQPKCNYCRKAKGARREAT